MNTEKLTDEQILEIGQRWAQRIAALSDEERAPYDQWAIDNNVAELLQRLEESHIRVQQYLYENNRNSK